MNRALLERWRDALYQRDWNEARVRPYELHHILCAMLEQDEAPAVEERLAALEEANKGLARMVHALRARAGLTLEAIETPPTPFGAWDA